MYNHIAAEFRWVFLTLDVQLVFGVFNLSLDVHARDNSWTADRRRSMWKAQNDYGALRHRLGDVLVIHNNDRCLVMCIARRGFNDDFCF